MLVKRISLLRKDLKCDILFLYHRKVSDCSV